MGIRRYLEERGIETRWAMIPEAESVSTKSSNVRRARDSCITIEGRGLKSML